MLFRCLPSLVAMLALGLTPGFAAAQPLIDCPPLVRTYGPFDYLDPAHRARHLGAVERRHFTEKVRTMNRRGETGSLISDLSYTLNWFPNHHGALDVLSRLAVRERSPNPMGADVHIDCRFSWARQVNPSDEMVPMIQGLYLHRLGRSSEARKLLESAVEMAPTNANVRYNLGLILVDLRDFDAAKKHGRVAYSLGFPLPGLKNRLAKAGHPLSD